MQLSFAGQQLQHILTVWNFDVGPDKFNLLQPRHTNNKFFKKI